VIFLLFVMVAQAGELDGTWRQDCSRGFQREEKFQGGSAAYTERNFRDLECSKPAVETISRGAISLGGTVALPSGARELDFSFSSVSLKPLDERAAKEYRERILCGFRDWRANEEKLVTGRECDFFGLGSVVRIPAEGDRRFGVVKVSGEGLFFGMLSPERDAGSPDRRPRELDPSPYRRVPEAGAGSGARNP
jgi:hypothetical protein